MLKKDEYNQEEYNDYYRQEIEGAELHGYSSDDEGGGMGKLIALPILLALAVAGYFGYNMMSKSDDTIDDKSLQVSIDNLPKSVQSDAETDKSDTTPIVEEEDKSKKKELTTNTTKSKEADIATNSIESKKEETSTQKTVEDEISNKVQQVVTSSESKISPEEIASIVAAVMKQINQEKSSSTTSTTDVAKQDEELLNKLSTTEVDSVSSDLEKALENTNISENTHIDNSNQKQVDVYNKVTVQNTKGTDKLSQLSAQISNEIENASISSTTTTSEEDKKYSKEIKKEVISRKKEMRIIIVKKGDTLGKLAKRAYGNAMEYKRIFRANPEITRPDRIYIGQKIRIPLD